MSNPYASKPPHAFWPSAVAGRAPTEVDPVTDVPFRIGKNDRLATAGSCFAQHISRTLQARGVPFLVTEPAPAGVVDDSYGLYPARFGNVYTVRQLRQLVERAYGLFEPADIAWRGRKVDGFVDPFRPTVEAGGFASEAALLADRERHLQAVQEMFEGCTVLVFTLGLTEGWMSTVDGAVFPLAPGVVARDLEEAGYRFHNFTVAEMETDLRWVIGQLRRLNPGLRILLTVSPVALNATFEDRHVLVSNTYSKAALRVVAEAVSAALPDVVYFPSYEIVLGAHAGSSFLAADLREVTQAGVAHVMDLFCRHFLGDDGDRPRPPAPAAQPAPAAAGAFEAEMRSRQMVICDEELIDAAP